MELLELKKEIYENKGYSLPYKLCPNELVKLRSLVEEQFLQNISKHYPNYLELFKSAGIENYHLHSHLVDHSRIWPKLSRCLAQNACNEIKEMNFFKTLTNDFSPFQLGRVVYEREVVWEWDEMYWRIVRPHQPGDVGTLHADKWFHDCMKIRERVFPKGANALKIWIPLYCEAGKNGLEVVEGSHHKNWDFRIEDIENTYKPRLNCEESQIERTLLSTEPGEMVIFNEDLVHVGAVNEGSTTRISLEITLIRTLC